MTDKQNQLLKQYQAANPTLDVSWDVDDDDTVAYYAGPTLGWRTRGKLWRVEVTDKETGKSLKAYRSGGLTQWDSLWSNATNEMVESLHALARALWRAPIHGAIAPGSVAAYKEAHNVR